MLPQVERGWDMGLTTHLHPVPRLRMCGPVTYMPFLPCRGTTLSFYLYQQGDQVLLCKMSGRHFQTI